MVRRLLRAGHQCAVFDMSPKAVTELAEQDAISSSSSGDLVKEARQATGGLVDGPGGSGRQNYRRSTALS
jgi:6-phosphogluconate dehydrogenase